MKNLIDKRYEISMIEEQFNTPETFSTDEEQFKIMSEMNQQIEVYAAVIHSAFNLNQLIIVIEKASKLIEILGTSKLTPRNYYMIYHTVSTSLLQINSTLQDETRFPNRVISELYETVQYLSGCMQRLYLMITIAPELSRRKIVRIVDVLDDLSDMTRAAQDPIRALFLRHYLLSIFKQYLPDSTESDTEKSLTFLLNNFAQMNRMWVRIEDIMASDERKSQRKEFSVLIGTNIQRISSLNGITVDSYTNIILPFIAKHVELCEDAMAQDFILRSIIHAFPEEFHIATIDQLFTVIGKVEQGVQILEIVNQLLERFLLLIGHHFDSTKSTAVFVTIAKNIEELFNAEGHLSLTSKFETLQRLLKFALKINSSDIKNVKNLMKFTDFHIDLAIGDDALTDNEASLELMKFLQVPLVFLESAQYLYKIEYLPVLVRRLKSEHRLVVADIIVKLFISSATEITSEDELSFYLRCAGAVVRESKGSSAFFSIIHLIKGSTHRQTLELIKQFYTSLDDITEVVAQKFIIPIGNILLHFMQISPIDFDLALDFLRRYLNDNDQSYPAQTAMVYIDAFKFCSNLEKFDIAKEFLGNIIDILPRVEGTINIYTVSLAAANFFDSYEMKSSALLEAIRTMVGRLVPLRKHIEALRNVILLTWTKTERKDILKEDLENMLEVVTNNMSCDIGERLKALYSVLDLTTMLIDKGVQIDDEYLEKVCTIISKNHRIILDSKIRLGWAVSYNSKIHYIRLAHHIQDSGYIKEDEEK
ncbi:hypothetical protein TVAG_198400 [Trichomonas vaginalis G3]|uniref:Vacuolar protein sorting-associated protein 35 n=1 Tax=Trichomonas vaginalis (strain ATCC PRA-98 / G3) TaxID=412133 RepID=A2DDM6_TRIV3|nr:negative regulation of late endosome to lysosome transport [Trichomonas vaginalis G3]EAY21402.1 hypothetical protein TVAG_198400 [Trichomonas vaginalis G3]KAI5490615.1 negative regulation of late endosome to lysosome transport [Trichomonas vaginalis G3]|eukprot:XP_001582388.1 hypothetical protein [Trichomonas vaginalis G3]